MKWNVVLYGLLFSGLGVFSYLLLANYSELPPQVSDILYSKGAFIFFISAFNILGYSTLRLSSWLNNQYALNLRKRWKIITIYIAVTLLFFLLNYSLLIIGKLLVGSYNIFIFPNGGWRILILVWLVELVIVGLLLSNRSIQNTLKLQQEAAELQKENKHSPLCCLAKPTQSALSIQQPQHTDCRDRIQSKQRCPFHQAFVQRLPLCSPKSG